MNRTEYRIARRTYRAQLHADRKAATARAMSDAYRNGRQFTSDIEIAPAVRFLRTLPDRVQAALTSRPVTLGRYIAERRLPANRQYAHADMSLSKRLATRRALRGIYPATTRAEQIRQGVPSWKLTA